MAINGEKIELSYEGAPRQTTRIHKTVHTHYVHDLTTGKMQSSKDGLVFRMVRLPQQN